MATFLHQSPIYRERVILEMWNKGPTEASMQRCHMVHLFKLVMESLRRFVYSYPGVTVIIRQLEVALFQASWSIIKARPSQVGIRNVPFTTGDYMQMMKDQRKLVKTSTSIRNRDQKATSCLVLMSHAVGVIAETLATPDDDS